MATIKFSGLATGLDTASLIQGLVSAERAPLARLNAQRASEQNARQVLLDLASRARDLAAQADGLEATKVVRTAGSSDAARVSATAGAGAVPGVHEVVVTARASATTLASQGHESATATGALGTGTLRVLVGGVATEVEVQAGQDSLQAVRDAINASGAKVRASIVDDGSASGQRLVVSGTETGLANAVALDASQLAGGAAPLVMTTLRPAGDAAFVLDGVPMTRASNLVDDALEGLTLDLRAETADAVRITVETDAAASARPLLDLVKSYNSLLQALRERTRPGTSSSAAGPLANDSAARSALARLQRAIAGAAGPSTLPNLSAAGITSARDGTLQVDAARVTATWSASPADVAALTSALGQQLSAVAADLGATSTGTLSSRATGVERTIRDLEARIARKEASLAKLEDQLTLRFTALETLASRLQSQGSFLSTLARSKE